MGKDWVKIKPKKLSHFHDFYKSFNHMKDLFEIPMNYEGWNLLVNVAEDIILLKKNVYTIRILKYI